MIINKSKIGSINTTFDGFDRLPDERKIELLNIINKYCTTPFSERNPIKKYRVYAYYEARKEIIVEAYNENEAETKANQLFYEECNIYPEYTSANEIQE